MRVHGVRLLGSLAAVATVGLVATALSTAGGPPRAAGQPQPSLTPESQITIPGGRSLAPGEDVTFMQPPPPTPTPFPTPGNGPIIVPSGGGREPFSPVALHVTNAASGRVFVSLGAPDFSVTAFDDVLVQLTLSRPASAAAAPGPAVLSACGADAARGNVVRCRAFLAVIGAAATVEVTITSVPVDTETQTTMLSAGESVRWVQPWNPDSGSPLAPALALDSTPGMQPVAVAWDGATLTLAAPDGYAVRAMGLPGQPSLNQTPASGACDPLADQPSTTVCDLSGLPQANTLVGTVPLAPAAIPALSYRDRFGAGTLTIAASGPDPAPGGEAVTASLQTAQTTLSGTGVLRPDAFSGQFALRLDLDDGAGAEYLFEGSLKPDGETFAGAGLFLALQQPPLVGNWQAGDPAAAAQVTFIDPGINQTVLNGQNPPPPGEPLPRLEDTLTVPGQRGGTPQQVAPPQIGVAGQPIELLTFPEPSEAGPAQYFFDWGDGIAGEPQTAQVVEHIHQAPGTYTVIGFVIDATGNRRFSATQIVIGPAS